MWFLRGSRKIILDVLGHARYAPKNIQRSTEVPQIDLGENDICLIWVNEPRRYPCLPEIVVVPNGMTRDFLAWAATFISLVQPFTAFTRVLDAQTLESYSRASAPTMGDFESACAGLVIGEALARHQTAGGQGNPSRLTCASTYSYVLARGFALRVLAHNINSIATRWTNARKLLKQPNGRPDTYQIEIPWRVLVR